MTMIFTEGKLYKTKQSFMAYKRNPTQDPVDMFFERLIGKPLNQQYFIKPNQTIMVVETISKIGRFNPNFTYLGLSFLCEDGKVYSIFRLPESINEFIGEAGIFYEQV